MHKVNSSLEHRSTLKPGPASVDKMFSVSTLALALSVLVLNISALPFPDLLGTRETTPVVNDTINAYDISLKHAESVPSEKPAISSHPEISFDVAHSLKKRDDAPNVGLVLSLLEGHGFQPVTTSHTMNPKATTTLATKVTTILTTKATSPSIPTTKASIALTTKATSTSITKTTTISTTKATITLTSKAISTLTAKATTILTTKAISTLTAKATTVLTTKAPTTTATTKTATTSITKTTTTTKATAAVHPRDLS